MAFLYKSFSPNIVAHIFVSNSLAETLELQIRNQNVKPYTVRNPSGNHPKVPVRSLIQFRSVSKTWKFLIDSSEFIAAHTLRHTHPHHLVVKYRDPSEAANHRYVSFLDDDTFPRQKSDLTVPYLVELLGHPLFNGSSHGLLCFYRYFDDGSIKTGIAVLWNPSIRKLYHVIVPYERKLIIRIGFGVCPVTIEPKIVVITRLEINLYTLSSERWRSLCSNLPCNSISIIRPQVVIDGLIYWLANDKTVVNGLLRNFILTFDLKNENFGVIDLPEGLAWNHILNLSICKLRESLTVLQDSDDGQINNEIYSVCVWMMKHGDGVQKSFIKLFTVENPLGSVITLGFRKSGELLVETKDENNQAALISYEPNSKHITDLGIHAKTASSVVDSYVETLLLLGQPDCHSF